jgi:hypothetical protein
MRRSNFALRLQPSLFEELRKIAQVEGVAPNQLINVAVGGESFCLADGRVLSGTQRSRGSRGNVADFPTRWKGKCAGGRR